jgi:hypothetical protein
METRDGPGLLPTLTLERAATFEPSAQPLHREGVTDHADATSIVGGHLELAQVSVVRPVLGGGMRPAHRPAFALGALHLRAHADGHRHHRQGARANRRVRSRGSQRSGRLKANYGEVAGIGGRSGARVACGRVARAPSFRRGSERGCNHRDPWSGYPHIGRASIGGGHHFFRPRRSPGDHPSTSGATSSRYSAAAHGRLHSSGLRSLATELRLVL